MGLGAGPVASAKVPQVRKQEASQCRTRAKGYKSEADKIREKVRAEMAQEKAAARKRVDTRFEATEMWHAAQKEERTQTTTDVNAVYNAALAEEQRAPAEESGWRAKFGPSDVGPPGTEPPPNTASASVAKMLLEEKRGALADLDRQLAASRARILIRREDKPAVATASAAERGQTPLSLQEGPRPPDVWTRPDD